MKRWRDLSDEARDAVVRENLFDIGALLAAFAITAVCAAIWKWWL